MHDSNRGPIRQIAYVVDDLDAGIRLWIDDHGVGPWTVFRNTVMRGHCRDVPTAVKLHVGLSYQDDLQIELIQVVSDTPSPYQDRSGRPLTGMHHIAWHCTDLDREVARSRARGLKAVFEASNGIVRVAYFESPQQPGPLYELIEAAPVVLEGFASGMQAAREWDGLSAAVTTVDFEA